MILAREHWCMKKELWQIRRDNLQALIDQFHEVPGNRAAFCRTYGLDPLQLGHYFTVSKNARRMGERKAREIEARTKTLSAGWLDQPHASFDSSLFEAETPTTQANDFVARYRKLQREYEHFKSDVRTKIDSELGAGKNVLPLKRK